LGQFLILADFILFFLPFAPKHQEKLRKWKNREAKPFAIMFESIEQIRKYCYVIKRRDSFEIFGETNCSFKRKKCEK